MLVDNLDSPCNWEPARAREDASSRVGSSPSVFKELASSDVERHLENEPDPRDVVDRLNQRVPPSATLLDVRAHALTRHHARRPTEFFELAAEVAIEVRLPSQLEWVNLNAREVVLVRFGHKSKR